jgi:hypothetical protein
LGAKSRAERFETQAVWLAKESSKLWTRGVGIEEFSVTK